MITPKTYHFLRNIKLNQTVQFLSLPLMRLVEIMIATDAEHPFFTFKNLKTLHTTNYSGGFIDFRRDLKLVEVRNLVWRVSSFLLEDITYYVFSYIQIVTKFQQWCKPQVCIFESDDPTIRDFDNILNSMSFETFIKAFVFHQSAQTIIYYSTNERFGIKFLKRREWRRPNWSHGEGWYQSRITVNDFRILELEEINVYLDDADRSQWPKVVG